MSAFVSRIDNSSLPFVFGRALVFGLGIQL